MSSQAPDGRQRQDPESGAAVADFVMVSGVLLLFFLLIIQLALIVHVRNTVIDAAASGARYGTLMDRSPEDAKSRAHDLIAGTLGESYAQNISVSTVSTGSETIVKVSVKSPLPLLGLWGPSSFLELSGRSVRAG